MTMNTAGRLLCVPALALALAGPARADTVPCESMVGCVAMFPVAMAYAGLLSLKPTPTLIRALKAVDAHDDAGLKRLIDAHPDLVRLTPPQTALLAGLEAGADRYRAQHAFVLVTAPADAAPKSGIEGYIGARDWGMLEWQFRRYPDLAAAVDGGYVLLREAAHTGNAGAVRMLLDAGVRADAHCGGALADANGADVRQLLSSRGAPAAAARPAAPAVAQDRPAGTTDATP